MNSVHKPVEFQLENYTAICQKHFCESQSFYSFTGLLPNSLWNFVFNREFRNDL